MDFRSIMLNVNPCFIYLATLWLVFFLFRSWKNQAVLASSQCWCCTKDGRVHLSWASKLNVWLIVFLNFDLLCFCNSSPDLQLLICMGSQQHCIKNPRPDQSCCECCSCGWIHFFVGLPHQVGDTLVNLIYFFKWLWKFFNFSFCCHC